MKEKYLALSLRRMYIFKYFAHRLVHVPCFKIQIQQHIHFCNYWRVLYFLLCCISTLFILFICLHLIFSIWIYSIYEGRLVTLNLNYYLFQNIKCKNSLCFSIIIAHFHIGSTQVKVIIIKSAVQWVQQQKQQQLILKNKKIIR